MYGLQSDRLTLNHNYINNYDFVLSGSITFTYDFIKNSKLFKQQKYVSDVYFVEETNPSCIYAIIELEVNNKDILVVDIEGYGCWCSTPYNNTIVELPSNADNNGNFLINKNFKTRKKIILNFTPFQKITTSGAIAIDDEIVFNNLNNQIYNKNHSLQSFEDIKNFNRGYIYIYSPIIASKVRNFGYGYEVYRTPKIRNFSSANIKLRYLNQRLSPLNRWNYKFEQLLAGKFELFTKQRLNETFKEADYEIFITCENTDHKAIVVAPSPIISDGQTMCGLIHNLVIPYKNKKIMFQAPINLLYGNTYNEILNKVGLDKTTFNYMFTLYTQFGSGQYLTTCRMTTELIDVSEIHSLMNTK